MSKDSTTRTDDKSAAPRKRLRTRVFETGVGIAGFGGVLRAWRAEGNRLKNVAASLGKKTADMIAGTAVSFTFKLVALTWIAGMIGGVSTLGMVALLAAATGTASAAYSFSKSLAGDKLWGPKANRKAARVFGRQRLKKTGIAFAAGFAGGGLGLWLARTEIVQSALMWLHNVLRPLPLPIPAPLPDSAPIQSAAPARQASASIFTVCLSDGFGAAATRAVRNDNMPIADNTQTAVLRKLPQPRL